MLEQKEVKIQVMNKLAFCLKKPVESQHSSSSRKKTHTFTIIAMNFVQEQLNVKVIFTLYIDCFRKQF